MLKEIMSSIGPTRIVLDGLDECDESVQSELIVALTEVQRSAGDKCKLLVSSRDEPHIDRALRRKTVVSLKGETDQAIQRYIRQSVNDLRDCFQDLDAGLIDRIEQRLHSKANGTYFPHSS